MTDGSLLVLATQYSFAASFAAMAAGTLYFLMERANLTPDYSPVASLAAMVSFVAAINYFAMKDMVGMTGMADDLASFPTDFRYVDWLITTPLLLAMLPVLLGGKRFDTGLMARLIVADVAMIALGYVGEVSINASGGGTMLSWWCLLGSMVLWFYILYELFAGRPPARPMRGAGTDWLDRVFLSRLIRAPAARARSITGMAGIT